MRYYIERSAQLSDDTDGPEGRPKYRWQLRRVWDAQLPIVAWCMLNPSTADGEVDDATVRKVAGFSELAGYGGALIVNLFALRARNPERLRHVPNPIGAGNAVMVREIARTYPTVAAWGAHVPWMFKEYAAQMSRYLRINDAYTLGLTVAGHPRHPLMMSYKMKLTRWRELAPLESPADE